jgi:RNA binding exosome subunit
MQRPAPKSFRQMKLHNITFSAFFKEDELESGRLLFKQLLPEDIATEEERLEPETEGGVFTTPLYALKSSITQQKQAEEFTAKLLSKLAPEDLQMLRETLPKRVDDDCNLYIRLDRKALSDGRYSIHTRDAVHVRIKLACFPKNKENALKIAQELLNAGMQRDEKQD